MRYAAAAVCVAVFAICALPCFGQTVSMVTLGDSLTAGDGDDGVGGGYPARLLTMLQAENPASNLSNVAVSGFTSDDLINVELDPAVAFLDGAPVGNRRIALLWVGSNDLFGLYNYVCDFEYGNDYQACEDATFGYYRDNIDTILGALRATGAEVYIALLDDQSKRPVMTDPALRISVFDQISDQDVARMSQQVSRYNAEISAQAASHGATTVDFFNTTIFENWDTLDSDGNHPNGAGYDLIAAIWYDAVSGSSPSTYRLSVTLAGTGSGTVTSSPAGISCGADCSEDYAVGTIVNLTATPAAGSSFDGWSGACTGAGACAVTMSTGRSVRASFAGAGGAYTYVVPVVVHAPGDAGTNWRSSVVCLNGSAAEAQLSLVLMAADGSWSNSASVSAGASVEWQDIVVELFGRPAAAATSGALRVSSDQPLWITSRTFNQGAEGTFGQYLPALQVGEGLSGSDRGYLLNLKGLDFRTNVGLVNLGGGACEVDLSMFAASGAAIGTSRRVGLPAGRWVQKNDVFNFVGASPRSLAYVTLELASGSCSFWAYASVVDASTGDATTIPVLWE